MKACEVWLRRDFLLGHSIEPDEPACTCDDCPPERRLAVPEPTTEDPQ